MCPANPERTPFLHHNFSLRNEYDFISGAPLYENFRHLQWQVQVHYLSYLLIGRTEHYTQ